MSSEDCGLYEIRNLVTGRRYVGSSVRMAARMQDHRLALTKGVHHSLPLQRAWKKYGSSAFTFRVLAVLLPDALLVEEQRLIDQVRRERGYNVARVAGAPMRGRKQTQASRAKISAANKGRKRGNFSDEHRAKLRAAWKPKNLVYTDEYRAKLSAAGKARPYKRRGPLSPEHRAKLSAIAKLRGALSGCVQQAIRAEQV